MSAGDDDHNDDHFNVTAVAITFPRRRMASQTVNGRGGNQGAYRVGIAPAERGRAPSPAGGASTRPRAPATPTLRRLESGFRPGNPCRRGDVGAVRHPVWRRISVTRLCSTTTCTFAPIANPCSASQRPDSRRYGTTASGIVRRGMRRDDSVRTCGARAGATSCAAPLHA